MSSRNSTQAKLVAISDTSIEQSRSQSPPPDFIRKMLHYPDPKEAAKIIGEQAGLEFDQKQGSQGDQLKWEQQDLDARYKTSKTILAGLEDKFRNTKQFVKSCALHANNGKDGGEEEKVRFSAWRRQDQISIIVVGAALSVAIVMGAANVYANLMASGQPVFIEQPWIAVFLSMLVPAGSASLKFISNFFEYDKTKKRYALCVYILTALSLFTWTALFALNFSGASGGIDWNSLGEDNGKGALLVWIQLTAEILVAAALFLAAEDIYSKYSPETYTENLDYLNAQTSLKSHLAEHEALRLTRGNNHTRLVQINAARQAFINERIAEFFALRSRLNAISNF